MAFRPTVLAANLQRTPSLPKQNRPERIGPMERSSQHGAEPAEPVLPVRGRHGATKVRAPHLTPELIDHISAEVLQRHANLDDPAVRVPLCRDSGVASPLHVDVVFAAVADPLVREGAIDVDHEPVVVLLIAGRLEEDFQVVEFRTPSSSKKRYTP